MSVNSEKTSKQHPKKIVDNISDSEQYDAMVIWWSVIELKIEKIKLKSPLEKWRC